MSVLYPIAADAVAALAAPLGRAAREREARGLAGVEVEFVRELVGPAFDSPEVALEAYPAFLDGPGRPAVPPEDRYSELAEISVPATGRKSRGGQAEPVFDAGHRWPKPKDLLATAWRLSVAYWRIVDAAAELKVAQARLARRAEGAEALDPASLKAMARQPLRPVKPQQPLDIGLFEYSPPDAPHLIIPDE